MDQDSTISPEVQALLRDKQGGFNYQERRHEEWAETYSLHRGKVEYNRLIQRQTVSLPFMKQTILTLLKDIDDMPALVFENLDNDEQAQLFKNEYWKKTVEINNMESKDIVDKKQVLMYGRSFDQWQIVDGFIRMEVVDVYDILVSLYTDPSDLNTSRFLIHQNIFKPLSALKRNGQYSEQAIKNLEEYFESEQGIIKQNDNLGALSAKNERLSELGVSDVDNPVLGDVYAQLTLFFVYDKREGSDEEELFLKVVAEDQELLMSKPLDEVIGKTKDDFWKTHYPYNSWAGDPDKIDFWTDGAGDIMRDPAKIVNAWFSQIVENRSLKNLNMNLYDATAGNGNFVPQTWTPQAWGWYGLPGKPSEVYQPMTVADLSESLDELNFLITMAEKATGATSTQQGAVNDRQVTLGEVKFALNEAKDRVKGLSKFYTPAWKYRGLLFEKLCEAGVDKLDTVKLYKKGRNTDKLYAKEVAPMNWMTESGYNVKVWSKEEKDAEDLQSIQILDAVSANMPNNKKLLEIKQRKYLEYAKLTPDQTNEVMEEEKQNQQMMMAQAVGMQPPVAGQVNPMYQPPMTGQ